MDAVIVDPADQRSSASRRPCRFRGRFQPVLTGHERHRKRNLGFDENRAVRRRSRTRKSLPPLSASAGRFARRAPSRARRPALRVRRLSTTGDDFAIDGWSENSLDDGACDGKREKIRREERRTDAASLAVLHPTQPVAPLLPAPRSCAEGQARRAARPGRPRYGSARAAPAANQRASTPHRTVDARQKLAVSASAATTGPERE
jgi:hypothetical protein